LQFPRKTVSLFELTKRKYYIKSNYLLAERLKRIYKYTTKAAIFQFLNTRTIDNTNQDIVYISNNRNNKKYL
jgi:hypothetical protein